MLPSCICPLMVFKRKITAVFERLCYAINIVSARVGVVVWAQTNGTMADLEKEFVARQLEESIRSEYDIVSAITRSFGVNDNAVRIARNRAGVLLEACTDLDARLNAILHAHYKNAESGFKLSLTDRIWKNKAMIEALKAQLENISLPKCMLPAEPSRASAVKEAQLDHALQSKDRREILATFAQLLCEHQIGFECIAASHLLSPAFLFRK